MSSTTQTTLRPGVYNVDPVHSNVDFIVRHLVAAKVRGHFEEFSGVVTIGESIEDSSVEATVQAASITTNNEMRDGHLKSADFLDLENHPTLTLKSTKITPKGGNDYAMQADLTIRGVTKSVTFDLEFLGAGPGVAEGSIAAGFEARTEIDRRDFNVAFEGVMENGTVVVGNKVIIELTVELGSTN
jgi:polyisoprenoid-binding protein YceI